MANDDVMVASALKAWRAAIERANKTFSSLTDEQLQREIAPGKNRVLYLLGHLAAVHDGMLPLLGIGARRHAALDAAFVTSPDKASTSYPSAADVKQAWTEVNGLLDTAFGKYTTADWAGRHTAVSEEDFAKDPTRNRFGVLITRTNHLNYHAGQAALAPK